MWWELGFMVKKTNKIRGLVLDDFELLARI